MANKTFDLSEGDVSRIIEMAWEDRTTFEAIKVQFKISESQVIDIMRLKLKPNSFRLWRKRVSGRKTKHQKKIPDTEFRHKCPTQGKKY